MEDMSQESNSPYFVLFLLVKILTSFTFLIKSITKYFNGQYIYIYITMYIRVSFLKLNFLIAWKNED